MNRFSVACLVAAILGVASCSSAARGLHMSQPAESSAIKVNTLLNDAYHNWESRFSDPQGAWLQIIYDLQQAHDLAPLRTDILYSLAGAHIANQDPSRALKCYTAILEQEPYSRDALMYVASWNRFLGNKQLAQSYFATLQKLYPAQAQALGEGFTTIDKALHMPIMENVSQTEATGLVKNGEQLGIVLLGLQLNDDGSMKPDLIQRLEKTKQLADLFPQALIFPTGGMPHNNVTEGEQMTRWLTDHGVNKDRIYPDAFAHDTVENAALTIPILADRHTTHSILVTSSNHIRRAWTIFQVSVKNNLPPDYSFTPISAHTVAGPQPAVTPEDILGIYRDMLRSLGLQSYRSAPLIGL